MDKFSVLLLLLYSGYSRGYRSSQCGTPLNTAKIVGGVDTGAYRYPWFALLLLKRASRMPTPVCAGSLITPRHVLTAAHCFNVIPSIKNKDLYIVALAVYDICDDEEATRQLFDVADVAVHEKYQASQKFYDIAVMTLASLSIHLPICLPNLGIMDVTVTALVIGFGSTTENSASISCHMMEVNVTKYSKKDCMKTNLPLEDKKQPSVICAGALDGTADSCYGDSGGPLQIKMPDGRYVLAGIVSYGYGCGVPQLPGIYTNVGYYMKWINDKISDARSHEKGKSTFTVQGRRSRRPTVTFPGHSHITNRTEGKSYFRRNRQKENRFREKTSKNTTRASNSTVIFPN